MEELTGIDALAAVRYASVFRNFQSTADYAEFFATLERAGHAGAGPAKERAGNETSDDSNS